MPLAFLLACHMICSFFLRPHGLNPFTSVALSYDVTYGGYRQSLSAQPMRTMMTLRMTTVMMRSCNRLLMMWTLLFSL